MAGSINFEVIDSVLMNAFQEVLEPFAPIAVASLALPAGKLARRAVHADEEDIVWGEEVGDQSAPLLELDDVIDDEIVAGLSDRRETAVESLEESRSHLLP